MYLSGDSCQATASEAARSAHRQVYLSGDSCQAKRARHAVPLRTEQRRVPDTAAGTAMPCPYNNCPRADGPCPYKHNRPRRPPVGGQLLAFRKAAKSPSTHPMGIPRSAYGGSPMFRG